jgi:murein DD-endopeptidase MepM/ murein hydrolase activator NlpD
MSRNKITKYAVNGVLLAALAAIGVAAYQLGTTEVKKELIPEEVQMEENTEEDADEDDAELLVNTGTSQVEASLETLTEEDASVDTDTLYAEDLSGANVVSDGISDGSTVEMSPEETVSTTAAAALPELNFSEDTLMEWPVTGSILQDYNMSQTVYFPTLDQYKVSPAIAVQAAEGDLVQAAVEGTISSICEDAQTGTTVTLDLGNGYEAIYGQLQDLTVSEGETVAEGQTIGYISAPTKYYSTEGSNLYFAMKKDGEPIDPILYLP